MCYPLVGRNFKMKFKVRPFLYFLLPIPIVFGIVLITYFIINYPNRTETQQNAAIWTGLIVLVFFFALPILSFKKLKEIERINGIWKVNYPYLKRTIQLDNNRIKEIIIVKGITGRNVPQHEQINISTIDGQKLCISSLEINGFAQLRALLTKDLKSKIKVSSFGLSK